MRQETKYTVNSPLHAVFQDEHLYLVQYNKSTRALSLLVVDRAAQVIETNLAHSANTPLTSFSGDGLFLLTLHDRNLYELARFALNGTPVSRYIFPFMPGTHPIKFIKTGAGVVLLASLEDSGSHEIRSVVYSLDMEGNITWQTEYPGDFLDLADLDGDYLISVETESDASGNHLIKLSVLNKTNGRIEDQYSFVKKGFVPHGLYVAPDHTLVLTGSLWSSDHPFGETIKTEIMKFPIKLAPGTSHPAAAQNNLTIYPNPVSQRGKVMLHPAGEGVSGPGILQIFNIDGQLMESLALPDLRDRSIETGKLGPGIYLLRWINGRDNVVAGTFIKN